MESLEQLWAAFVSAAKEAHEAAIAWQLACRAEKEAERAMWAANRAANVAQEDLSHRARVEAGVEVDEPAPEEGPAINDAAGDGAP